MNYAEEVVVLRRDVGPFVGGEENLSFGILNGVMMVAAIEAPVKQCKHVAIIGGGINDASALAATTI